MKTRVLLSLVLVAVVGLVLWMTLRQSPGKNTSQPPTASGSTASSASPARTKADTPRENADPSATTSIAAEKARIQQSIREALEAIRAGNPEEIERALAKLDGIFKTREYRAAAIAAIVEFLATGADSPTGKGFVVGENGVLVEASTLRVYLMDWLGQLSGESMTGEAVEVAREILSGFGSADEWAISMRNIAWEVPEQHEFLVGRVNAMIRHPQWQEHPTAGMLEAYDVIVHTGSLEAVPELIRQILLEDSALGRASGVALDRLASAHPLELATYLNGQPQLMQETPMLRADLFAHADLSVAEQRTQLETYLLRPDVGVDEREKFFSSLIQTGQFVSHNLITPLVPPEEPAQAERRLETLVKTVNGWMRDARFQRISGELSALGETVNRIVDEISADEAAGGQK